jgi:hypothetical protein
MECGQFNLECADPARRREFTAHQTHDVKIPLSVSKRIPERDIVRFGERLVRMRDLPVDRCIYPWIVLASPARRSLSS